MRNPFLLAAATSVRGNDYALPLNGTFQVKAGYEYDVASLGPTAGDFARGQRTLPLYAVRVRVRTKPQRFMVGE